MPLLMAVHGQDLRCFQPYFLPFAMTQYILITLDSLCLLNYVLIILSQSSCIGRQILYHCATWEAQVLGI